MSRYAVFRFFFGAPPASFSSISGISSLSRYSCCSASDPVAPAMADLTAFFLNCTGLSRPGTLNGCSRSCTCGLQSPPPSLQSRLSRPKLNRHRCWRGSVFLERAAGRLPDPVLPSTAMAYEPNRRTAFPARRQPLVRGGGKGAGAGAGRARPPPNQVAL